MVDYFYHLDYLPNDGGDDEAVKHSAITREQYLEKLSDARKKQEDWEDALSHVDATDSPPARPKSFLVEHAKVFATAVKYQVDGLRQLAVLKFKHLTTEREAWKEDDFAQAVSIICTSTPEDVTELRDVAVDLLYTHFGELKDKDSIEEVMCNHPKLMWAFLERKSRRPSPNHNTHVE
jgi:hypothetical protein